MFKPCHWFALCLRVEILTRIHLRLDFSMFILRFQSLSTLCIL